MSSTIIFTQLLFLVSSILIIQVSSAQAIGHRPYEPVDTQDIVSNVERQRKVTTDYSEYYLLNSDHCCNGIDLEYSDINSEKNHVKPEILQTEANQDTYKLGYIKLVSNNLKRLPLRTSPTPRTTNNVPHIQIGIIPIPQITTALLRRVAEIPNVEIRETVVSLPGAKGFWLKDDIALLNPQVIVGGREFAHVHPDGSLHISLPPKLALEVVETGWGTHHPWANQRPGWNGFIMLYTPLSESELAVVLQLIIDSYNFVTGDNFEPS